MSFNADIRRDIKTLDVTINNFERMENASDAWERIKKIVVAQNSTSPNKAMLPCLLHKPKRICVVLSDGFCGNSPCQHSTVWQHS
ncbi:MAG: hypothetical protein KC517_09390 [Bacteroidetes bacterium]|nr:hypothetical protein [Bacteroidota bacterium]